MTTGHRIAAAISLIIIVFGSIAIGGDRLVGKGPIVVVIDAGHGGKDPGAVGQSGVREKDITLAVARCIAREAVQFPGLCVVLTRTDDRFLELRERIDRAHDARAAVYVSLHVNAAADATARGVETYFADGARNSMASKKLAQALQPKVIAATRSKDRGVRSESFYIRRASMPAALVEIGFITEKGEAQSLQDPKVQDRIALGVLSAISQFVQEL